MTALISLSDYKQYKKLSKTDSDDELNSIIASVSSLVKTYCGHSFIDYYTDPVEETFNIMQDGQTSIQLNEWPARGIVSVNTRSAYNQPYVEMSSDQYFLDTKLDTVFLVTGDSWQQGIASIKIAYNAGWETTPEDVRLACLDLVHHYYKEEYKDRKQIGNISVDNANRFTGIASKWPVHISRVLHMYRN